MSTTVRDGRQLVESAARTLLDPQGRDLAGAVQWWELEGLPERWPVAVIGQGPPLLLLHGFDSSFLEFRRLAPLLAAGPILRIGLHRLEKVSIIDLFRSCNMELANGRRPAPRLA